MLGILVIALGPGWQGILAVAAVMLSRSAGRWAGVVLIVTFGFYVAGIMYGIRKGIVVAPEDSDSDSETSIGEATFGAGRDDDDEGIEAFAGYDPCPVLASCYRQQADWRF